MPALKHQCNGLANQCSRGWLSWLRVHSIVDKKLTTMCHRGVHDASHVAAPDDVRSSRGKFQAVLDSIQAKEARLQALRHCSRNLSVFELHKMHRVKPASDSDCSPSSADVLQVEHPSAYHSQGNARPAKRFRPPRQRVYAQPRASVSFASKLTTSRGGKLETIEHWREVTSQV